MLLTNLSADYSHFCSIVYMTNTCNGQKEYIVKEFSEIHINTLMLIKISVITCLTGTYHNLI